MDCFRCDKCQTIGPMTTKRGRLIVMELGPADGQPHASLYNSKLEVCASCFNELRDRREKPSFAESSLIITESRS